MIWITKEEVSDISEESREIIKALIEKGGRDVFVKGLLENGGKTESLTLYEAKPTTKDLSYIKDKLLNNEIELICFTSPSCVSFFIKLIGKELISNVKIASIGPITSKALVDNGLSSDIASETFTSNGLVEAICKHYEMCKC